MLMSIEGKPTVVGVYYGSSEPFVSNQNELVAHSLGISLQRLEELLEKAHQRLIGNVKIE